LFTRACSPLCRLIAAKLVGDQPPWLFLLAFQDLAKKALGGPGVATGLNEDIEYVAILIDGAPQIVLHTSDLDEYLIGEPRVTKPAFAALQCPPIAGPKLETPSANGLVGHLNTALGKKILDVAEAQRESVIEPDRIADDLWREPVAVIASLMFAHPASVPDGRSR